MIKLDIYTKKHGVSILSHAELTECEVINAIELWLLANGYISINEINEVRIDNITR